MFRTFATLLLAATLTHCLATPSQALDLSGTWTGNWHDFRTGHKGPLRATFSQLEDGNYQVHFRGRFAKIIPFRYTVVLEATEKDGKVELAGTSNISRRRGTFYYKAEATDTNFVSSFRSRKDNGEFRLSRSTRVTAESP
tara:strand:- start:213 stop:632 length:420 start_codon:yes stop_codon:yes gene_type:complete